LIGALTEKLLVKKMFESGFTQLPSLWDATFNKRHAARPGFNPHQAFPQRNNFAYNFRFGHRGALIYSF
jgi:hypothetical protein